MAKKVYILSSLIIATLFFSVLAVTLPVNAQGPDREQVVVAFGKVPGQDLYAHVWVVIPHGSDKNQIVNESLRQQGLKISSMIHLPPMITLFNIIILQMIQQEMAIQFFKQAKPFGLMFLHQTLPLWHLIQIMI
jgi:hypothetical protein